LGCASIAVIATLLGGCAYDSGDESSPFARKVTWFSFVGADDIRAACHAGAPDRFRIIYNGVWSEQVRIYEIGANGPRRMDERVIGTPGVDEFGIHDLLAPWRGITGSVTLSDSEYATLLRDLGQSGAYRSPDSTLTLAGNDFYWVAASCHDGTFHLTAWRYPSEAFDHVTFGTWLVALDSTGVPFNPPRSWTEVPANTGGTGGMDGYSGPRPAKIVHGPGDWAFGIAQDRMVGQITF